MKVIDNTKKAIKSIYNNLSKLFSLKGNQEELDNLHKTINTITFVLTTIIFIISVFTICFGLSSVLSKNESKLRYIVEDGIRYIELVDGYIKEELVVETGTILPDLKSYFRDDYELPDNISAQYFENNNALNLEQFTYKVNGDYYLKGIRTINVTIFGDYEYETKLSIVDTTSPTVTLQDVSIPADETLDLKKFVKTYMDNSQINDYTINFKEDYDLTKEGTQNVTLVVCDVSDNCNEGTAKLTITKATKPNSSGSTTKPSTGNSSSSNKKPSTSSSSKGNSSSSNKKPKTLHSFDASKVITPTYRSCKAESKKENNYNLVIDHYGTTESMKFNYIEFTRDEKCQYNIIDYRGKQRTVVNYAYSKFNGRVKTMLEEAMYIYNQKNNPDSDYKNTLNDFLAYTNNARKNAGLKNVELNYHLCMIATMRAMELAYSGIPYQNHLRPDGTYWETIWNEYGLSTPSARGENIVIDYASDKLAFQVLFSSTPHRNAILNSMYGKMGVGKVVFNNHIYIVQTFST